MKAAYGKEVRALPVPQYQISKTSEAAFACVVNRQSTVDCKTRKDTNHQDEMKEPKRTVHPAGIFVIVPLKREMNTELNLDIIVELLHGVTFRTS